ncbi:hypothetical protein M758_UG242600 [Ceratodon purpureus]|nr:hypothetical protein M758_UG242600 [Ceratodon purpureus]
MVMAASVGIAGALAPALCTVPSIAPLAPSPQIALSSASSSADSVSAPTATNSPSNTPVVTTAVPSPASANLFKISAMSLNRALAASLCSIKSTAAFEAPPASSAVSRVRGRVLC